ncbi:WD repeat protein [Tritrichomonas foetus]|uniref:WD repeat protein n=1 Tax=Tritrichomonas foetus TaxID=1144522 RepID=A0A1J4KIP9_9EUKA|nr:WD repeat protein [Tritrichomonas foetus]|eukprot:OHT11215.1 WD repeat protein [Tritrichomonas foetus]
MSYADLLHNKPIAKRTSTDRLISPPQMPRKSRNSLTPDRKIILSQTHFGIPTPPLRQNSESRFKVQRSSSISTKLFSTNSQELFGSPIRRQNSSDFSNSSPCPQTNARQLPSKPLHKIPIDGISCDFYISPMDWSKTQQIAFSISGSVAFINPKTSEIRLAKNAPTEATALKYNSDGSILAVGCDYGKLELYSVINQNDYMSLDISETTILTIDWKDSIIASGSRDGLFGLFDTRTEELIVNENIHFEEICGIKFSHLNHNILATSSNDSTVKIWDLRNLDEPIIDYQEHSAAIRALAFSPTADNIIATGGGTSDKTIKMWDINTGETIYSIDTGSQVCNLFWNEDYNEIFSTHGFSQNHLALWRGSDLSPVAQFYEHKQRVLFMANSPDNSKVATAAPNDGVQIWQMFPSQRLSLTDSMKLVR